MDLRGIETQLVVAVASTGAGLLTVAGVLKLRRPWAAADALAQVRLPRSTALVRVAGTVEVLVGVAWLVWPMPLTASVLSGTYAAFLGLGLVFVASQGANASCGCLGSAEARFTATHVLFNAVVCVAGATAAFSNIRTGGPSGFPAAEYWAGLGLATYLSYLLLTEFDGAIRAFGGDGAASEERVERPVLTLERSP